MEKKKQSDEKRLLILKELIELERENINLQLEQSKFETKEDMIQEKMEAMRNGIQDLHRVSIIKDMEVDEDSKEKTTNS
jgi:hypothetical protein